MKSVILFDFDGVIVDSLAVHLDAYRAIFKHFGKHLPFDTPERWREHYDSAWENNFLNNGFSQEELAQALNSYGTFLSYEQAPLFSGIEQVIAELSREFPLGIVSTTRDTVIADKLEAEGLRKHFQVIMGKSESSDKAQRMAEALQILGGSASHSAIVGDTASDIRAGKKSGLATIAVSYGWYSAPRLEVETPTSLLSRTSEIIPALRQIIQNPRVAVA